MSEVKHTRTPWGIEDDGAKLWIGPMRADDGVKVDDIVCGLPCGPEYRDEYNVRQRANAALIVASVNQPSIVTDAMVDAALACWCAKLPKAKRDEPIPDLLRQHMRDTLEAALQATGAS